MDKKNVIDNTPRKIWKFDKDRKYVQTYHSLTAAAKSVSTFPSSVRRACLSKRLMKNYYWRYADKEKHPITIPEHKIPNKYKKAVLLFPSKTKYPIRCDSIAEAASMLEIPETTLRAKLNKKVKKIKSFEIAFENEKDYQIVKKFIPKNQRAKKIVAKNPEMEKEFKSISECSKNLNIPVSSIQRYVDKNKQYKGFLFYSAPNKV